VRVGGRRRHAQTWPTATSQACRRPVGIANPLGADLLAAASVEGIRPSTPNPTAFAKAQKASALPAKRGPRLAERADDRLAIRAKTAENEKGSGKKAQKIRRTITQSRKTEQKADQCKGDKRQQERITVPP